MPDIILKNILNEKIIVNNTSGIILLIYGGESQNWYIYIYVGIDTYYILSSDINIYIYIIFY